ncbi:TfuA-like protein [Streptomyces vinaceus]|uniref:TfuA-like protein n=1 Tax=Streptomyces vinaceus TaxID=1960 RepID=UPI00367E2097
MAAGHVGLLARRHLLRPQHPRSQQQDQHTCRHTHDDIEVDSGNSLIDQGIEVYGAAGMGALRAAELAPFGMTGIGAVFRAYRDEEIVGDDEVALLHADAESGHRALSWAQVYLRHAVAHARRTGVTGLVTAALLV